MNDNRAVLIQLALAEDIGSGDVTSEFFVSETQSARAFMTVRKDGVVSGIEVAAEVFLTVDPTLGVEVLIASGSSVAKGAIVMKIEGNARSILTAERTALNFAQHLSGIATLTATFVALTAGTSARILDTRKTKPGYRLLEKQAVLDGGGTNHRLGLYDRAMVKDNHLVAGGGIGFLQNAAARLKRQRPDTEIEVEADHLEQVAELLELDFIDHILLDNMSLEAMREAVRLRGERARPRLEASGNVNLQTVSEIAATGVDFISVGAITHSAPALDIGLDFSWT
jgi:nicotinate-nucleotide pyrophosphorylase (carboxylating)